MTAAAAVAVSPVLTPTPGPSLSPVDADAAVHAGPLEVGRHEMTLKHCVRLNA